MAPLYGVTSDEEPDYLDYDIKGRGTLEKMFLYSGSSYLTGRCAAVLCFCFVGGLDETWDVQNWQPLAKSPCLCPFSVSQVLIHAVHTQHPCACAGILSGGVLGGRMGYKAAPSPRFWIRLNSVMNGAGKYGSKWGNNMGVIGACRASEAPPACDYVALCMFR